MKKIIKYFKSMKKAGQYQNRLYTRYGHVRLVSFPGFSEDGDYTWEVEE